MYGGIIPGIPLPGGNWFIYCIPGGGGYWVIGMPAGGGYWVIGMPAGGGNWVIGIPAGGGNWVIGMNLGIAAELPGIGEPGGGYYYGPPETV